MALLEHEERKVLERLIVELAHLPSHLRQSVADALWAHLPAHVSENPYSSNANQLQWNAQSSESVELITAIMAYVPGGQTGWLQLGNQLIIPLGAGITVLSPGKWLLQPSDARAMFIGVPGSSVLGTPGAMWAHLSGEIVPTYGVLGGP